MENKNYQVIEGVDEILFGSLDKLGVVVYVNNEGLHIADAQNIESYEYSEDKATELIEQAKNLIKTWQESGDYEEN
jgi:GTP cyclohydrolase II